MVSLFCTIGFFPLLTASNLIPRLFRRFGCIYTASPALVTITSSTKRLLASLFGNHFGATVLRLRPVVSPFCLGRNLNTVAESAQLSTEIG